MSHKKNPSKSKVKAYSRWEICTSCNCFFYSIDPNQNEHTCTRLQFVPNEDSKRFYAKTRVEASKNSTLRDRFSVNLSEDTMFRFGLLDGNPVLINNLITLAVIEEKKEENNTTPSGIGGIKKENNTTPGRSGGKENKPIPNGFVGISAAVSELLCVNKNLNHVLIETKVVTSDILRVTLIPEDGFLIGNKTSTELYLQSQLRDMYLSEGFRFSTELHGRDIPFIVGSIEPKNESTESQVSGSGAAGEKEWFHFVKSSNVKLHVNDDIQSLVSSPPADYQSLAGFSGEIEQLKEILNNAIKLPINMGCLIHGPSGSGRTTFGCMAPKILPSIKFSYFSAWNIFSRLRDFKELSIESEKLHVIFLDELDLICENPENRCVDAEVSNSVKDTVEALFDVPQNLLILASVEKIENLHPSLLSRARFNNFIELKNPKREERLKIVEKHLKLVNGFNHRLSVEDISSVTDSCHAFDVTDLTLLCTNARINAELKSHRKKSSKDIMISKEDLMSAYAEIKKNISLAKEDARMITPVLWDDIAGYDSLKLQVRQLVEWPIKHEDKFRRMGMKSPQGMLLYGPPGCCKTMIAKAIATECKFNFFAVQGPELLSKYFGDSEKNIRQLFSRAKRAAPSIVFFDEIDSIASSRQGSSNNSTNSMLSSLLTEMDGMHAMEGVFVLAATNLPSKIDSALLRPGRLGHSVYVPLPCPVTRRAIFEKHFEKMEIGADVDLDILVQKTEMFSGAEIAKLFNRAGHECLDEIANNCFSGYMRMSHFQKAFESCHAPGTSVKMIAEYERFERNCGDS